MAVNELGYDVYVYKFDSNVNFAKIGDIYDKIESDAVIYVRDLSNEKREDVYRIINAIIASERIRVLDNSVNKNWFVHIIQYEYERYIAIAAVWSGLVDRRSFAEVFRKLFKVGDISYYSYGESPTRSRQYFSDVLEFIPLQERRIPHYTHDAEEVYDVKLDKIDAFHRMLKDDAKMAKSCISAAICEVMMHAIGTGSILFGDVHDFGMLSLVPVFRNKSVMDRRDMDEYRSYFLKADYNDLIEYSELVRKGSEISNNYLFTEYFISDYNFTEFLEDMKEDVIYKLKSHNEVNAPMAITIFACGGSLSIKYNYSSVYFGNATMSGIHESICAVTDMYVVGDYKSAVVDEDILTKNNRSEALMELKRRCISRIRLFDSLNEAERGRLMDRCNIFHAICEQNIMTAGSSANKCALLVKGRLEMDGKNSDRMIVPLCVLKEGELIGLESLYEDNTVRLDYRVLSEEAVFLTVSPSFFEELMMNNHAFLRSVLRMQDDKLYRFERLWMMS